ncbi:sigma-54-dependent transcriptional regulator [Athalassotoga saccharophila]|uniref:sigma-54-dependent transcriptional regulator n=1 Tax=Athalassotoga saccharophila TaxID=1441386 RepID=UPI00137AE9A1|nr:sigma-54 dependent transcriptional regulator [Athalassotoga saccharophila]BBJ27825.1 regulatory protein AtoC [Athalassotoga saccharophila]
MNTVLFVDDEGYMLELMKMNFSKKYNVLTAQSGLEALDVIRKNRVDLVVTDIKMPKMDGMELLKIVRDQFDLPVIIITAFGTIENAVEAIKKGAYDYITKPINLEDLETKIDRSIEYVNIKRENSILRERIKRSSNIITKSEKILKILDKIPQYANLDLPILILGESGTGKELIARAIHDQSSRCTGPFIAVNMSAVPAELFESEFFGYEQGAFTGANSRKIGKFEAANGGTLFLDEIGDMPLEDQAKLLRVLQDFKITRLGSVEERKVDFRLISATNKPLEKMIEEKKFREDLYYRINVIRIEIPPLRERPEDIELLSNYYVNKYAEQMKKSVGISPKAMEMLKSYKWPGNVRELQNVILRAVLNAEGEITAKDLPLEVSGDEITDYKTFLLRKRIERDKLYRQLENQFVSSLLFKAGGNVSKAAEMAKMDRRLLQNMIKHLS